ncbi:biotin-dependent carboxyltransferase family protein [Anaerobacillus sp. 1_MG-2023]|uniref:5-oxoprolinase subunit C family protein n=1 Tax=Anaerobacillus sp. 1_MG-2023 TaxID=3062655 RepID=UPI0026E3E3A5|nr:biotin-dependent carboxyltransferase family protein [Anaerobacillus sp. 1_MG-2023]MDO6656375.1 biotin-dependent carboxyltransferase family protein [Anaerobacillus sp. 1_MG-2023]
MKLFSVEKPGLYTTYQDLGRVGFLKYGVPASGALDRFALQVGNILVGNKRDAAGLEVTMQGPELIAEESFVVAVTGGDLSPMVNGKRIPLWKSVHIKKGQVLEFGQPRQGVRAYLTVSGGFHSEKYMGSRSVYEPAGLGRPLQKEDKLVGKPAKQKAGTGLFFTEIPDYDRDIEVRVVKGPHHEQISAHIVEQFFASTHEVSPQSNRMGYRLQSDLETNHEANVISDGVPVGGIQLPGNGQPIILLADRQTTGGYTRIGTVIGPDLPLIAQLPPGRKIRFIEVTVEEAQEAARQTERKLRIWERIHR